MTAVPDMDRPSRIPVVLTAGFRLFFLAAGLYAIAAMAAWLAWLGIHAFNAAPRTMTIATAPHLWHGHEMIFGYGTAALAGFFLTAVPNWTGGPPARAAFVASLGALWLAGRLAVWFSASLDPVLVGLLDLLFVPALAAKIVVSLVRRPKPQNMALATLLGLIFAGNLMVHLEWAGITDDTAAGGLRLGLLTLAAMITVIGGRVVPAFTRNALIRETGSDADLPLHRTWADRAGIAGAVVTATAAGLSLPDPAVGAVALVAAVANGIRLSGWRWRRTLHAPILWSLHLGFAMLVAGYAALAVADLSGVLGEIAALHLIGIGAVGGMTMAVMTRAALGHTGRPLAVSRPIALAYLLVAASALVRAFGSELAPDSYFAVMFLAGGLWCAAFALFVIVYWPILTRRAVA